MLWWFSPGGRTQRNKKHASQMWRLVTMKPTQWLKWIMCIFLTSACFLFTVRMRKWDTRLDHSETEMRTPLSKNSRGAWVQQQFDCKVSKNKSGSSAGLSQLWVFSSQSAISGSLYKYLAIPHTLALQNIRGDWPHRRFTFVKWSKMGNVHS